MGQAAWARSIGPLRGDIVTVDRSLTEEDGAGEDLSRERIPDRFGNCKVGEACPCRREKIWEDDIANSGSFGVHGIHDCGCGESM